MKKLSLLLALCLLMTLFTVPAMAASGTDFSDNFNGYTDTTGTVLPEGWTAAANAFYTDKYIEDTNSSGASGIVEHGFSTIKSVDKTAYNGGAGKGNSIELSTNHKHDAYIVYTLETPATGVVQVKFSLAQAAYGPGCSSAKMFYLYDSFGNRYDMFHVNYEKSWWSPIVFDGSKAFEAGEGIHYELWYDFNIKLDLLNKKGVCVMSYQGTSRTIEYDLVNLNIKDVAKLQYGIGGNQYYRAQGTVSTIYLDDISVKSLQREYAFNRVYEFDNFEKGAHPALGTQLTDWYNSDADGFRLTYEKGANQDGNASKVSTERGYAVKLTQNWKNAKFDSMRLSRDFFDYVTAGWGTKVWDNAPVTSVFDIGFSVKFDDLKLQRTLKIGSNASQSYEPVVFNSDGSVGFGGAKIEGVTLKTDTWYDIDFIYDVTNKVACLEIYENGKLLCSETKALNYNLDNVYSFSIGGSTSCELLEEDGPSTCYIADISLTNGEPVYMPADTNYEAFDIAFSTPMTGRKVAVGTPLSVTFNNAIDQSTFTSDSVKVYENGTPIDAAISFEGTNTVLLGADLDYGKNYDVVFTNVSDGTNTLTDYIEFSTYAAPFVFGETSVSGSDTEKTITTTVSSGDGFSHKVNYISALYEGNRLISVKIENADIYPGNPLNVSADLAMPTAPTGAEIKVKGMLWNADSAEPIKEAFEQIIQ